MKKGVKDVMSSALFNFLRYIYCNFRAKRNAVSQQRFLFLNLQSIKTYIFLLYFLTIRVVKSAIISVSKIGTK